MKRIALGVFVILVVTLAALWLSDGERSVIVADLIDPVRTRDGVRRDPLRPTGAAAEAVTPRDHVTVRSTAYLIELLVETVDTNGERVGGAELRGHDGEAERLLGFTEVDGTCIVAIHPDRPLRIFARGLVYASQPVDVDVSEQISVRLVLEAAEAIAGVVVWAWGGHVGPGVMVRALEPGQKLGATTEAQRFAELGNIHEALTDVNGAYTFVGLDPKVQYRLVALSPSCVSVGRDVLAATGSMGVRIRVGHIYGAHIEQRDASGGMPLVSSSLRALNHEWVYGSTSTEIPPGIVDALGLRDGFDPEWDAVPLFTFVLDQEQLGPRVTEVVLAGHERGKATYSLKRVVDGQIPTQRLVLVPHHNGLGQLDIHVTGGNRDFGLTVGRSSEPPVVLAIRDPASDNGTWMIPLKRWPRHGEVITVEGVPNGRYEVTLRAAHGMTRWPSDSEHATVDVLGTTAVTAVSPDLGAATFEVLDSEGQVYRGPAEFVFESGTVNFFSAPYVVEGLPVGAQRVSITRGVERSSASDSGRGVKRGSAVAYDVVIEAGRVVHGRRSPTPVFDEPR